MNLCSIFDIRTTESFSQTSYLKSKCNYEFYLEIECDNEFYYFPSRKEPEMA